MATPLVQHVQHAPLLAASGTEMEFPLSRRKPGRGGKVWPSSCGSRRIVRRGFRLQHTTQKN